MQKKVQKILSDADIRINGSRPWDVKVNNPKFYSRVLSQGSLGLGESYTDGWWDCKALDQFFDRLLRAKIDKSVKITKDLFWLWLKSQLINMQSKKRAYEVGKKHYDIGNELYEQMLGKTMMYSCAYWKNAKTLDEAQEAKLELICKKLELKPGMKVLDIGCGWGGFAKFAAKEYKVRVVGITISKEQLKLAQENCAGLDVEIRMQDYRSLNEKFDRIVSVGMFEHVGTKNYKKYMKAVSKCLNEDGLFLLHTIGTNKSSRSGTEPWINKYIFPNGHLPSVKQIAAAAEKYFILEDWHNFGKDYDLTLMAWHKNFIRNWDKIKENYDERFKRMWEYYLLCCAGAFRSGNNRLWQIVFSKNRNQQYSSIR